MNNNTFETYKKEIQTIVDFYSFFHIPGKELEKLVMGKHEFNHFYAEYVGKFAGLNAEKVILFNSKASYKQTAVVFHTIYNRAEYSESEFDLGMSYLQELVTLRATTLFFYNWTWEDIKAMMEECPELKCPIDTIMKKNQGKKQMVALSDVEFFEVFLNTSSEGKAAIMHYALKTYKEEAERGIKHGLQLYKTMEEHIAMQKGNN